MIYRIDKLTENRINPITEREYDSSWIILMLTDSEDYQQMCGSNNGCAYTIKISRSKCHNWKMAVCDFIGFGDANEKNVILVMTKEELEASKTHYDGHSYNDRFMRENEPSVLVHSTPMSSWKQIKYDGMYDLLIEQIKAVEGVTEQLKEENQMEWVCLMNNVSERVTEIITHELIYT